MEFDQFTVVLLQRGDNPPVMTDAERTEMQDAHLAHLAHLVDEGYVGAAGPIPGDDDRHLRGITLMRCDVETALRLKSSDPAVQCGFFKLEAHPWMVPAGAVQFGAATFPRSTAEATA